MAPDKDHAPTEDTGPQAPEKRRYEPPKIESIRLSPDAAESLT
jgi:hypothetical protein